jgi:hypothetical protein
VNAVPQPGDVITVTTRYRTHYYKRTSDFEETTYENVRVLRPLPWLQAHEFCIPADGPETEFARIDEVERFDRAPEFDQQAMRYESNYTPSNSGTKFNTRVINMKNVVAINGKPVEQYQESIQKVEIASSRGGSYTVLVENGIGKTCECKGFQFRGRCRHLQEAEQLCDTNTAK